MPALAITTSTPPVSVAKRSTACATARSSPTSAGSRTWSSPVSSAARSRRPSSPRATRPSRAPLAARRSATARPIPRVAPVIRTRVPRSIRTAAILRERSATRAQQAGGDAEAEDRHAHHERDEPGAGAVAGGLHGGGGGVGDRGAGQEGGGGDHDEGGDEHGPGHAPEFGGGAAAPAARRQAWRGSGGGGTCRRRSIATMPKPRSVIAQTRAMRPVPAFRPGASLARLWMVSPTSPRASDVSNEVRRAPEDAGPGPRQPLKPPPSGPRQAGAAAEADDGARRLVTNSASRRAKRRTHPA